MALGDAWSEVRESKAAADVVAGIDRSSTNARWVVAYDDDSTRSIYTAEDSDLFAWTSQTPPGGTGFYRDLRSDNASQYKICGTNGLIPFSANGTAWGSVNVAGNPLLRRFEFGSTSGANLFLACGEDIIIEQDGFGLNTWSDTDTQTNSWYGIGVDSGTTWVVCGTDGSLGQFAYRVGGIGGSPNGYDNVKYSLVSTTLFRQIQFGNSVWVAVGDGGDIYTAADPTAGSGAWTKQTSPVTNDLYDVVYTTGSIWLAVGASGTILRSDDNGVTWATRDSKTTNLLRRIRYDSDNNLLLAAGDGGLIITSDTSPLPAPSTVVEPTVTEPVPPKTDFSTEAVSRLATQFRS